MRRSPSPVRAATVAVVLLALLVVPALGVEPMEDDDELRWYEHDGLTGDWFGSRSWLEDHGVELDVSASFVWQALHKGGIPTSRSTKLTLDLQYIQHPGAEEGSSILPGFRFEIDF